MKEKKFCPHCNATMVEYRHSFSKALAAGLHRIYSAQKPVNLKELGLTRNQWDNFQKLRYWGLVGQSYRDDGVRIGGVWHITQAGIDFIERGTFIKKYVYTYRGEPVRFDGDVCFFEDVHPDYEQRESYSANAVPHMRMS